MSLGVVVGAPLIGWLSSLGLVARAFAQTANAPAQDRARVLAENLSWVSWPVWFGAVLSLVALVAAIVFGARLSRARAELRRLAQ